MCWINKRRRKKREGKQTDGGAHGFIVSDNSALDFLLSYRDELFPVVPVVFCGVNNISDLMTSGHRGITRETGSQPGERDRIQDQVFKNSEV
jgi:hypothetical protein